MSLTELTADEASDAVLVDSQEERVLRARTGVDGGRGDSRAIAHGRDGERLVAAVLQELHPAVEYPVPGLAAAALFRRPDLKVIGGSGLCHDPVLPG